MVKDSGIAQKCLRRIYLPCKTKLTLQRVWIEKFMRAPLFTLFYCCERGRWFLYTNCLFTICSSLQNRLLIYIFLRSRLTNEHP